MSGCRIAWVAPEIPRHPGLAGNLLLEARRRIVGLHRPELIARAAWAEAAYCLDAPDEMPAGSCVPLPLDDEGLAIQSSTYRDEHAARALSPIC